MFYKILEALLKEIIEIREQMKITDLDIHMYVYYLKIQAVLLEAIDKLCTVTDPAAPKTILSALKEHNIIIDLELENILKETLSQLTS